MNSPGALGSTGGWRRMSLGTLVPLAATLAALGWLAGVRLYAQNLPTA